MQIPKRASEMNRRRPEQDHLLSSAAIAALREELVRLEKQHPRAAEELRRASEMGDRSENAAYHDAKGRLMRINTRMLEIREELKNAIEIEEGPDEEGRARVGSRVKVLVGEVGSAVERVYEITGSAETDPLSGRISHLSPLGMVLVGQRAGDVVMFKGATGHEVRYEIIEVS